MSGPRREASPARWQADSPDLVWPSAAPQWEADWISAKGFSESGLRVFHLRHRLEVAEGESLLLHIAAESGYFLFLDGKLLGRGPVRGTTALVFFDTWRLRANSPAPVLIEATVFSCSESNFRAVGGRPAVCIQVDDPRGRCVAATNSTWEVSRDSSVAEETHMFTPQIGPAECRDLSRMNERNWTPADVMDKGGPLRGRKLVPRDIPALEKREIEAHSADVLFRIPDGGVAAFDAAALRMQTEPRIETAEEVRLPIVLDASEGDQGLRFDFGTAFTDGVALDIEGGAGTIVDIGYGEHIHDGRLRLNPCPTSDLNYRFLDRLILGTGRVTVRPAFNIRGGRYIELAFRGIRSPVTLHALRAIDRRFPLSPKPPRSDLGPLDRRVYAACVETIHACAMDTLTDCPMRESAFWVNDAVVEIPVWLGAGGHPGLVARCLRLALSQAGDDGLIPAVCPCPEEARPGFRFPATNAYFLLLIENYMEASHDLAFLAEVAPVVDQAQDSMIARRDASGLFPGWPEAWNFVDWSFPLSKNDIGHRTSACVNWFHVLGLQAWARLQRLLGNSTRERAICGEAARLAAAIHAILWNEREGGFFEWPNDPSAPCSQLASALALLDENVPQERVPLLLETLGSDRFLAPELFMHYFVFRALDRHGRQTHIQDLIRRYWHPMVEKRCPTVLESFVHADGDPWTGENFERAASFCHGFSTAPLPWLV